MIFRSLHALVAAVACVLLTAPAAFAAASAAAKDQGENTPLGSGAKAAADNAGGGSTGGGIVRTIVGLAVVLAVIYGLHWVLKQVKAGREQRSDGSGLETIGTLALGPGRSLHLVRTGREVVLVGSAEKGVSTIRVYEEDEARRLGLLDDDAGKAFGGDEGSRGGRSDSRARRGGGRGPKGAMTIRDLLDRIQRLTVRG
jgi:flagellar protein FliO/FliZ